MPHQILAYQYNGVKPNHPILQCRLCGNQYEGEHRCPTIWAFPEEVPIKTCTLCPFRTRDAEVMYWHKHGTPYSGHHPFKSTIAFNKKRLTFPRYAKGGIPSRGKIEMN